MKKTCLIIFSIFFFSCSINDADLIIHNAVIYTVNKDFDKASAVVVKNGKFIAVGGEELLNLFDAKSVVNLKGFPVYPGFIDSHCHFYNLGLLQEQLDLSGTQSFDEVVQKIQEYIESYPGIPVLGQGWDQNTWDVKEYPTNLILNKRFPNQLIAVKRHGKWGYCDYNTQLKIPYLFNVITAFQKGVAIVKNEAGYGLIDTKGIFVIPAQYEAMQWITPLFLLVQLNDKYGIINRKGELIIPIQYNEITITPDNKLIQLSTDEEVSYQLNTFSATND